MIIRIIAGGPNPYVKDTDGFIIAVDKGLEHALALGLNVSLAVGDFDSTNIEHAKHIETIKLPSEKDQTDLQVAIEEALKLNPTTIYVYGATNGRYDHYHAAVQLLRKGDIRLVDETNEIRVVHNCLVDIQTQDYISFFHYSGEPLITLEGFKYPLKNYFISPFDSKCISNELKKTKGTVKVQGGHVLMVISHNDHR
jgi:thiamine pyrophosphokinase